MWSTLTADLAGWLNAWRQFRSRSGGAPAVVYDSKHSVAFALDDVWVPCSGSTFVSGWMWDPEGRVESLSLRSPGGHTIPIRQGLFRTARPDVVTHLQENFNEDCFEDSGFFCCVQHPDLRPGYRPFRLIAGLTDGAKLGVSRMPTHGSPMRVRLDLLGSLPDAILTQNPEWGDELEQAISTLSNSDEPAERVRSVTTYGNLPETPDVSIIIPVFRTPEMFRAQLACLSSDRTLQDSELIFVLDSPEMQSEFERLAFESSRLYNLPLRLVTLKWNYGYSSANNTAATCARSPLLLFLNSDVFPIHDGWVGEMKGFYRSKSGIGALGPKLLYEDDSLQHAGMYFSKDFFPGTVWQNCHYFKGFARGYPAANKARIVPAVTGACMMLGRREFDLLGGWDESYVIANFEDSDLCIRAHAAGLENWYIPSVELYHLEGQSQVTSDSHDPLAKAKLYNCWLQTRRWDSEISRIMASS